MIGRWVPAANRTRAVALFTSMLSVGTMISLPDHRLVGARSWVADAVLRIRRARARVGGRVVQRRAFRPLAGRRAGRRPIASIPWSRLLRSRAVWAIIVNHFCGNWALYVLLAWLPSYFKTTFNVSLANAGLLSAAPWAAYFVMGNVAGWFADTMIAARTIGDVRAQDGGDVRARRLGDVPASRSNRDDSPTIGDVAHVRRVGHAGALPRRIRREPVSTSRRGTPT